jgi:hypothetical protein
VCSQPASKSLAIEAAGRDAEDDTLLLIDGGVHLEAVENQEDFQGRVADALVAIKKRVVAINAKPNAAALLTTPR